jgi:N6-adenosine-specific RNA methylase IME4
MKYRTILADPPWKYNDKLSMESRVYGGYHKPVRGADAYYETMTVDEICALASFIPDSRIAEFEANDPAFLFLWVTNPMLLDGSGVRVARAWGFEPKQLITWIKCKVGWDNYTEEIIEHPEVTDEEIADLETTAFSLGMGRITRGVTEQLIIATRGKYSDFVQARNERNVVFAPRREHSKKPDSLYDKIERLVPGPYLELFATQRRDGWTSWGKSLPAE